MISSFTTAFAVCACLLLASRTGALPVRADAPPAAQAQAPTQPPAQAQAPASELQKRYDDIVKRFTEAKAQFEKKLEAATDDEERVKLFATRPGKEFAAEFKAVALAAKGSDLAAKAWIQVAENGWSDDGKGEDPKLAVATLLAEHIESPEMIAFPRIAWILGQKEQAAAYARLLEKSPHKSVRAAVLYYQSIDLQYADEKRPVIDPKLDALFEELVKDYGDLAVVDGTGTYRQFVEGYRFAKEHLQVGKTAPDFEAIDENGASWKLGDYRGKVVLVEFWSYRLEACRTRLPRQRELAKRLEKEPFALLGINSDGEAATLKKLVAQESITWRQAVDGSTSGPLATKWNIKSWPTLFVIDAKGVIRMTGHTDNGLDALVDKLIAEAKGAK